MDSQDINNTGYRAKSETEDFINRYINDHAKGWPKLCFCRPVRSGYHQKQPFKKCNILNSLLAL
jgi:hypothetical protein